MQTKKSSNSSPKHCHAWRSTPSRRDPSHCDGDGLSSVIGAYLDIFGRPPFGSHPEMDGYIAGRVLAEEYPETMQQVMSGIRQGVKEGQTAAEPGGPNDA